ncbi:MAG UNVERIFIED_CONTAM: hypothetical protein LVR18_16560 [Planctomycetaceae bacterium]|jgi:hypothetical protein
MRIGGGTGGETGKEAASLRVMDWTGCSQADFVNIVASTSRSNRGAIRNRHNHYEQAD